MVSNEGGTGKKIKVVMGRNQTLDLWVNSSMRYHFDCLFVVLTGMYLKFPLHNTFNALYRMNGSTQRFVTTNLELPDDERLSLLKSHVDMCFVCVELAV